MLFDILFIADWQKIGEHKQGLTDLNNARESKGRIDYDYKVASEVQSKMISMGHQISSCHVPVVRSFFIL
jgi:hypothetical protein